MSEQEAEVATAGGALKTLIHQFSDPLSFYRELVQNALDAGSMHVDVSVTYDNLSGQTQISIEDGGVGMDSHVIDTQLTRLFASKKDGDLTRIGKFGIGFVSVFSLQPERVTLETWSEGEGWLVEFLDDGRFERRPLETPREGTLIRVFKSMSVGEYEELKEKSRETLVYWCKHVGGEIRFHSEVLNQPFGVNAPVMYKWEEPDTEIAIGYPEDGQSFVGFYNQGLTLMESPTEHIWQGLAVKANSRFLEHTLTRDSIVEDENFRKVTTRIQHMVENELATFLLMELDQNPDREAVFGSLLSHYGWRRVKYLKSDKLSHAIGEGDGENWRALPGKHQAGFLVHDVPGLWGLADAPDEAVFRLSVPHDQHTPDEEQVAQIAIWDWGDCSKVSSRKLTWGDFRPRYGAQAFSFEFNYRPEQKVDIHIDWSGGVPLTFHSLELRRRVTRELNFNDQQKSIPVFRSPAGESICLSQVEEAQARGRLWFVPKRSSLSSRLQQSENLVVMAQPGSREWDFASLFLGSEPRQAELERVAPVLEDSAPSEWRELWPVVQRLAREWGGQVSELCWAYPDCEQSWSCLLMRDPKEIAPYDEVVSPKSGHQVLVVNSRHESILKLLELSKQEPHLAAYLLCKQFLAQTGLDAESDSRLALAAWRFRDE